MEYCDLNTFIEDIKDTKGMLVLFYSTWCPPCRMLKPIIDEFIKVHPDIKFNFVNNDKCIEISKKYRVLQAPSICYIKEGKIIDKLEGYVELEEIEELYNNN